MTGPVVGVLVGAEPPALLRTFVEAVATQVRIAGPPVAADAYVVYRYAEYPATVTAPAAVWVDSADEATDAAVLLTDSTALADQLGPTAVLVADTGMHDARPVSPWVRGRLRAARGLASELIVRLDRGGCVRYAPLDGTVDGDRTPIVAVPPEQVPTAVAVASALIAVTPEDVRLGLAWGAPIVTDPEVAALVGVRDGAQVRVAVGRVEQLRAARALAADLETAAALGWRGRLFQEQRDLRYIVRTVLDRLLAGVGGVEGDPERRVVDALDHLGTPASAAIRDRAALFTTSLFPTSLRLVDTFAAEETSR